MGDKLCFVIAPIGDPDSETRKRSDQVLKHVIRPAVEKCGYRAVRADEISEPGLITSQVIQHVVADELVVADLSERNANVFYELALRHAIRKPLVQIIRKGEALPFDIAGMRTIAVDHRDLDSVEDARGEIERQIRAVEKPGAGVETPISVSVELQHLRSSDNPEQRTLGEILTAVTELRSGLGAIEQRVTETNVLVSEAVWSYSHPHRVFRSDAEVREFLMRSGTRFTDADRYMEELTRTPTDKPKKPPRA